jgi:hypothetical protein
MIYLLLFALEMVVIFFLSKRVQRTLSRQLMQLTHNKNITVYVMALLFFPGTFIHEVSHFLVALFLLVPVGNMHLLPVIEDDGIRLGSVSIANTDPIRRFLIGIAPLLIGSFIIILLPYLLLMNRFISSWWLNVLTGFLIFTISNSMFSSKKDMEGMWGFVFIVSSIIIILYFLGITIDITTFLAKFENIFKNASIFLTIPIVLDMICLTFSPRHDRT